MKALRSEGPARNDLARADLEIRRIRVRLRRLERRRSVIRWFQRTFAVGVKPAPALL